MHHKPCSSFSSHKIVLTEGEAPSNTQAFLYFQIVQAPRIIRVFTPFLCSFFTLLIVLHHQSAKLLSFWQGTKSVSSNGWSNLNHIRLQWDSSRRITRTPWLLKYCMFCFYHPMLLLPIILPSLGRACLAELQLVSLAPKFCGASKLGVRLGEFGRALSFHFRLKWPEPLYLSLQTSNPRWARILPNSTSVTILSTWLFDS